MALLDRKALLAKEKLEIKKVSLNDKDFVYVRQMTGFERDRFEKTLMTEIRNKKGTIVEYEQNLENFRSKLAVKSVCDKEGNLILQDGDYDLLSKNMSAKTLEAIINIAQELNKISEEDKENLVKNSEGDQVADSISDSVKS
jgi:hypothetical protein